MKVLVAIKRVVDPDIRVRPLVDGRGMDIASAKMVINPFCEQALEEAIRLKELGLATEVLVVSIGTLAVQEQLRRALAMGADRALHIETEAPLEPLTVAKVLREIVRQEQPELILLGQQSVDGDHAQTGQMLAALCGYPQGTFVSHLEYKGDEVWVTSEANGFVQILALKLPAVITTGLRLNTPRSPTVMNLIKAQQKPLSLIPAATSGLDLQPRLNLISIETPSSRQQLVKVTRAAELVEKLRQEAKVI